MIKIPVYAPAGALVSLFRVVDLRLPVWLTRGLTGANKSRFAGLGSTRKMFRVQLPPVGGIGVRGGPLQAAEMYISAMLAVLPLGAAGVLSSVHRLFICLKFSMTGTDMVQSDPKQRVSHIDTLLTLFRSI